MSDYEKQERMETMVYGGATVLVVAVVLWTLAIAVGLEGLATLAVAIMILMAAPALVLAGAAVVLAGKVLSGIWNRMGV
jgi:hypothetical protein